MNTLHYIVEPVSGELERVEKCLADLLSSIEEGHAIRNPYTRTADRAVAHLFRIRGKRLRPVLFLLSAKSAGAAPGGSGLAARVPGTRSDELVQIATAIELIHSASLVHDDVIDEAVLRRGRASVNERYGNKIAVLSGDILFTQFYSIVSSLELVPPEVRLRLLALFTDVTRRMCFGEIYEEQMRNRRKPPEIEDYLDTIDNKTASLMSVCCEAGALVVGASDEIVKTLRDFGHHLGMSYQLLDDLDDRDGIYPDSARIADVAASHVRAATDMISHLPRSEATDRLRAIVSAVCGSRAPDAAERSA
ncbi:MAG TPA: polyprenyl synthetase family protein [Spirochaetia bacterium]|nr:polyprenyl synthetase family protein [Spirochaetia bacterium]